MMYTIAVVGNPNCGKTTLFNALTGAKQQVGNWPGVTVDRKTGSYNHESTEIELVDLPGIYSLTASSADEEVARDYMLSGEADLVVNIVDASNIERNLYLTAQLLEMKVPMLVALNMMDVAKERRIEIDVLQLAKKLGCPVLPIVASKKKGLAGLKSAINKAARRKPLPTAQLIYPVEIQEAASQLRMLTDKVARRQEIDPHWFSIKLLEGDEFALEMAGAGVEPTLDPLLRRLEERLDEEVDIVIADNRYGFIKWLTKDAVRKTDRVKKTVSDTIDRIVLNRFLGIPVFLLAMYMMFMFTINLGGAFIDFFDILFGAIFVDGFASLLYSLGSPEWLVAILAGGLGGGIQTVSTFIPPIGFMFIALSFLEDSGYMARAAFVMDRFMRFIGLPGKAFIPMLVGFGCNVPAIMATRTLENERDRTLTIMMNPFMSCGARLPVYALFAAAFFPVGGQNLVFSLYLVGIVFAVVTGLVLKNTLLKGEITPFVMELPPYHLPTLRGVLLRAWDRLKSFIFRAGKVLVPVVMVLAFLNTMGTDGSFGNEDSDKSVLAGVGKAITPVFEPMGLTEQNWPATVGLFTGIFAKEAVVGTLDSLYAQIDATEAAGGGEEESFSLLASIGEAVGSIPANLADLASSALDPLGLSVGDVSTLETAADEQEVSIGTFGSMVTLFGGKIAAFSYLLFVLLYFPCSAAIAAVYRETNLKWTIFVGAWTTGLAYMASTIFYQAATFAQHPVSSLSWIGALIIVFWLVFLALRFFGSDRDKEVTNLATARA